MSWARMQLLCTRCGAPLPKSATYETVTCAFCGGTEAPAPRVVESVRERVLVVEATPRAVVSCPRCGGAMQDPRVGANVLMCERCRGIWIDPPTLERLRRQRDDQLVNEIRLAVGAFAPRDQNRRPHVACPTCQRVLERLPLSATSVESYDVCPEHGAFFDYGELRTFVDGEAERRAGPVDEGDVAAAGLGGWRWPWSR